MLQATAQQFNFYHIVWYFIIYSFIGWCIEVVFCSITTGKFVNRGFLNGPVCPIYGFGSTFVIVLLSPIQHNIPLLFLGSVFLTSSLELLGGWILETAFHTRWWDYSDKRFNLGGYICLSFSLSWGVACLFLMKVAHPFTATLINILPPFIGWILLFGLYSILLCDFIFTVSAIFKLNHDLGEITRIANSLHESSERVAESLGNKAIAVANKVEKLELDIKKESFDSLIKEKYKTAELKHMLERKQTLLQDKSFVRNRLLKAFPSMKNKKYTTAFLEMKENLKNKNNNN